MDTSDVHAVSLNTSRKQGFSSPPTSVAALACHACLHSSSRQQQSLLLRPLPILGKHPAQLTGREGTSSGRFQYHRIYSLLSFDFQDKNAQLQEGTEPFVFQSPDTPGPSIYTFSVPDSIPEDLISALFPALHIPHSTSTTFRNIPFLSSQPTLQGSTSALHMLPYTKGQLPLSPSSPSGRPFWVRMWIRGHQSSPS